MAAVLARTANGLGLGIAYAFSVPYAGRLLKWGWALLLTAVWALVRIPETLLWLAGVRWEKRLRVRVVFLRDEEGQPLATPADFVTEMEAAAQVLRNAASIRIEYGDPRVTVVDRPAASSILEPGCGALGSLTDDLGGRGSAYERLLARNDFGGNFRRLVGYGASVVVVVVRGYTTRHAGCSLGPFADYVTVKATRPICIAHELGHALGLPHTDRDDNLMFRKCGRTVLRSWQVIAIRASRQVTTF